MSYYFGVDIGGTNIAMGIVNESFEIVLKEVIKTNAPRPFEEMCDDIVSTYNKMLSESGIAADSILWIGVGCPGIIKNGIIIQADNLRFRNVPLAQTISQKTGRQVFVQNDANAAAFGELIAGSGKSRDSFVAITLGTGIGSGIIINRSIYEGFNGGGAEIGHIVIDAGGRKCVCGAKGCFEAYCSANALIKDTKKAMIENPESRLWQLCGGDINNVNGKTAFDGVRRGDRVAADVIDNYIEYLSIGIINIINLLQPEMICIGGGISGEGEALLKPLKARVDANSLAAGNGVSTELVMAKLGNSAGIIGAAMLGKQEDVQ